ncbi:MAG: PEP/pyruvate-binding domain-containing protein, partial [Anaerolineae bacterium]
GQQDTYLNVVGFDALHKAVIDCWSSLWTARAIGYRARNSIDHANVSLAVVVQAMVPSEASGVLFTANPLTGKRTEIVIDATLGLGEALVSGQVEPDHYIVDADEQIVEKTLGRKALAIHGREGGGTITVAQEAAAQQALSDDSIRELAHLGRRVADYFGVPQDVEWARVDGYLSVLQSRPITTLYPLPEGMAPEPLRVLISFGAVQGMLDPITPVGQDTMRAALTGAAQAFDTKLTETTQSALLIAGYRLWINFTGAVNNRVGRRILLVALPMIDPVAAQVIQDLLDAGCFPSPGNFRLGTFVKLLRVLLPALACAVYTLFRPDASRVRLQQQLEALVADGTTQMTQAATLDAQVQVMRRMARQVFHYILPKFVPRFGMGMAALNLLTRLAAKLPGALDVLILTRGLPHNVTTEMDLALWDTAQSIRADPASLEHCARTPAPKLSAEYQEGHLPEPAQAAVSEFIQHYGARGLAEIDPGRPRWRDDPTPVMQSLQSYLRIPPGEQSPDVVFERGRVVAKEGVEQLVACARQTRGGWLKARVIRAAAYRLRALAGLRESPKFTAIRLFDVMRQALLKSGQTLVEAGTLAQPDDVFFLYFAELEELAANENHDWVGIVRERRQAYAREQRRRQIPRLLLSDGQTFYEGARSTDAAEATNALTGSPVSPGVVEGVVHIVFNPHNAQLAPGEILVCPGTDPSWTPLFLAAGGLVMEVGGLMTHGGVVAREYGIPAVVGIPDVTRRLKTGQRIRVDGTTGQVVVLDEDSSQS